MNSTVSFRSLLAAFTPIGCLIAFMLVAVKVFGGDVGEGASQVSLVLGTAVAIVVARLVNHVPWAELERGIVKGIAGTAVSILILLLVGMLSGAWMIGGVVPTLICHGVGIMNAQLFLASACVICAGVALMTGTSWTTVATLGVALLGIGNALGVPEAWSAGAIISGAYFGDKLSPLSDTTVLASSATGTELFTHIRYMLHTTIPSMVVALAVYLTAGFFLIDAASGHPADFVSGLEQTFNISLWTLFVPLGTLGLILCRLPSLMVLFLSALMAGASALVFEPEVLARLAGAEEFSLGAAYKGLMTTFFSSTHLATGSAALDRLVATRGMGGMMNTIWLIICAVSFGGVMYSGGMLGTIGAAIIACVRRVSALVGATAFTGWLMNMATGDQYISILVTADMFGDVYRRRRLETKLLSRTIEDSSTVTSVLVPWNTCAMAQSASLGVATLTYLPFCFFNLISPFMSVIVAATGWGIRQATKQRKEK